MPNYIGGIFDFSNNNLDDAAWDYIKNTIDGEFGDYKGTKTNKFYKYYNNLY